MDKVELRRLADLPGVREGRGANRATVWPLHSGGRHCAGKLPRSGMEICALSDEDFMQKAIEQAMKGERTPGGSPIGCVIVLDNQILSRAYNEVEAAWDPTAHAEILAIRRACISMRMVALRGATLYSTLQPCGMCTMAVIWAKIGRLVYGAGRMDVHRMYFEDRNLHCDDFVRDAFRDDLSLVTGVRLEECVALYPAPDEAIPAEEQANL